ncbi:acyltransferase [uncultured Tateyamaria sp.]|uniref:acyltransferase family protein n=1 Tax=uncultured Tateyamaria sp. TaxID=455651 RepID=UPI0026146060|nr:acyltransferase [uncultured Tateyamaria sp.]
MIPVRLPGLQVLRAFAALMVLIGHVMAEAEHYFGLPLPGDAVPWTRGVDIFFVISGFVITLSAGRLMGQPGTFLWRRLVRVVPLYFLFTTLMVAVLIVLPGGAKDTSLDPAQILSSYSFIPYERSDGRIAPVLSLGWTLNYEIFFYALAALCLSLPRPFLALTALMCSITTLGAFIPWTSAPLVFWSDPIILEFLMGIGLARLWQRGWQWPHWGGAVTLMAIGAGLLIALDPTPLPRFIAAGVPAALIVASGTLLCPQRHLPGQIWGDASYALYLSHRFALRAATLLLLPLLPASLFGAAIYVISVCALALAVGLLTHVWIERPMMRTLTPRPKALPA